MLETCLGSQHARLPQRARREAVQGAGRPPAGAAAAAGTATDQHATRGTGAGPAGQEGLDCTAGVAMPANSQHATNGLRTCRASWVRSAAGAARPASVSMPLVEMFLGEQAGVT